VLIKGRAPSLLLFKSKAPQLSMSMATTLPIHRSFEFKHTNPTVCLHGLRKFEGKSIGALDLNTEIPL